MTQQDVAEALDVSPSLISRYERGKTTPDSSSLIALAQALDTRPDALLRPTYIEVTRPDFRKKSRLKRREEKAVLADVGEWIERYLELERIVDSSPAFDPVTLPARSMEDVEAAAVKLRHRWGLGLDPIDNMTEVLEEQGIRVCPVTAGEDIDALAFWADDEIPVIAIRDGVPGDRQRFSMAHELGHLVLEAGELDEEAAANRFAGAFLVPEERVRAELGDERRSLHAHELHLLKHKYGLSMAGWIYRAHDVGVLPDAGARRMWKLFSKKGWRKQEPGETFEPEEPTRMKRLLLRALEEDLVTPGRAAELLGMSLSEFQASEARRHAGFPTTLRD